MKMSIVKKPNGGPQVSGIRPRKKTVPAAGIAFLFISLLCLSVAASVQFENSPTVYLAGEVAERDIQADQELRVEDAAATEARRNEVARTQPPLFDLSTATIDVLRANVNATLESLRNLSADRHETHRQQLAEMLNSDISTRTFDIWRTPVFATLLQREVLPWLETRLASGVVADQRILLQERNGIIVRDLSSGSEVLREDLRYVPDIEKLEKDMESFLRHDLNIPLRMRRAVTDMLFPLLAPTLTLNREATTRRTQEVRNAVSPVYYRLQKGEIIVRQGEKVTEDMQLKLQALVSQKQEHLSAPRVAGVFLTALILAAGLLFSHRTGSFSFKSSKDIIFLSCVVLAFAGMAKGLDVLGAALAEGKGGDSFELLPFLLPVASAGGLIGLIFSFRRCVTTSLLLAFICMAMMDGGTDVMLFFFLSSVWGAWVIRRAQTRQEVVWSLLPLAGGILALWCGMAFLEGSGWARFGYGLMLASANAVLSLLLIFALSPIVELAFRYTTRFRLMELMNLEQPLLQELMVTVPGTYHHSLIVANMVEAGAKAIGANSLLCKVAALYHDIGKLAKPEYFIENQAGGKNKHNKLAPSMSALILLSHVKKGVEMARQHRLGNRITDIIQQHHGTSLIRFFYQKAIDNGENPRTEDYSYPGPKPQSREAAIVMLADAVEASSRTLNEPTPSRIRGHIETIMKNIFAEGQLDESELTFRQLSMLTDSFHRILAGIFHQRIEYPDAKQGQRAASQEDKSEKKKQAVTQQPEKRTTLIAVSDRPARPQTSARSGEQP